MSADVEVTHALLELGAATLGEWVPARCGRGSTPRGPARASRHRRSRCTARPATTSRSTSPWPAPPGDALVVDVGDFRELGYWGEVLTTGAEARGLSGLVIDGGVRDIAEIQAHGFPVFSSMIALRGAARIDRVRSGVPIQCGGVARRARRLGRRRRRRRRGRAGGDAGGRDQRGSGARAKEAAMFRALWDGRTTLELLNLDPSPIQEGDA